MRGLHSGDDLKDVIVRGKPARRCQPCKLEYQRSQSRWEPITEVPGDPAREAYWQQWSEQMGARIEAVRRREGIDSREQPYRTLGDPALYYPLRSR